MTTENGPQNPYAAVLADLRAKRDKIDNTIRVLEEMSGLSLKPGLDGDLNWTVGVQVESAPENDAGMFLGMSIVDAAKKLLNLRKRAMTNTEILSEIQRGGLVLNGADPLNVVGSVMTRRFNNVGDVVRVARGTWGLKEWYPNRTFKQVGKNVTMVVPTGQDEETNASEAIPDAEEKNTDDLLG